MDKKGQTGGLITGLVFGVASLVIGVIIAFVIVTTLTGAGLLDDSSRLTVTHTNETGGWVNISGYTLDNFNLDTTKGITITNIVNATDGDATPIAAANYTFDSSTGVIVNATDPYTWAEMNISYTVTSASLEERVVHNMSANFSGGVDEISKKVPTVLLIAAIILILGVLAILVGVWNRMRMGGGSEL